jgi:hypothetical protein
MSRFFTISLLLLGLGFAAYDGFQAREHTRSARPSTDNGTARVMEGGVMPTGNDVH